MESPGDVVVIQPPALRSWTGQGFAGARELAFHHAGWLDRVGPHWTVEHETGGKRVCCEHSPNLLRINSLRVTTSAPHIFHSPSCRYIPLPAYLGCLRHFAAPVIIHVVKVRPTVFRLPQIFRHHFSATVFRLPPTNGGDYETGIRLRYRSHSFFSL